MSPEVIKQQHCIRCDLIIKQQLIPSASGCDWQCTACKITFPAYTFEQMAVRVQQFIFGVTEPPKEIPEIPSEYKVFLKCEFESQITTDKEMEVSPASVKAHIKATGKLPQVGKTLYASVHGALVPYGEVIRIQTNGIKK